MHQKIHIPGGTALVGTNQAVIPIDGESPIRKQQLCPFLIDNVAVSNERFEHFVDATNYQTEAESIGWSYVFFDHLPKHLDTEDTLGATDASWWRQIYGANWKLVNGPESESAWQSNSPAVHISHKDALAFAKWCGGRLPIEAEWSVTRCH